MAAGAEAVVSAAGGGAVARMGNDGDAAAAATAFSRGAISPGSMISRPYSRPATPSLSRGDGLLRLVRDGPLRCEGRRSLGAGGLGLRWSLHAPRDRARGRARERRAAQVLRHLLHEQVRDAAEGLEHALAGRSHRLEARHLAAFVQFGVELFDRVDVGKIALVVLDHPRDLVEAQAVLGQVRLQVGETLLVLLHLADFAVGNEDDGVRSLEHELAGGVVEHLARHRVEQEAGLEPHDLAEIERQQIEEERPVGLRLHADHLAAAGIGHRLVDGLEVRRLAAQARTVVDELRVDLLARVAHDNHGASLLVRPHPVTKPDPMEPLAALSPQGP